MIIGRLIPRLFFVIHRDVRMSRLYHWLRVAFGALLGLDDGGKMQKGVLNHKVAFVIGWITRTAIKITTTLDIQSYDQS